MQALLPSPLLPPPAGWVRCKAHHPSSPSSSVWWNCDTGLHKIARAPSAPSTENNKSGAVRCEQCLSISMISETCTHCICVLCMCVSMCSHLTLVSARQRRMCAFQSCSPPCTYVCAHYYSNQWTPMSKFVF